MNATAWECSVCSQDNPPEESHCWWCKNAHGDWVCDCGRRNRKADEECSECGQPKPDAE